jgi:hypothetical protein
MVKGEDEEEIGIPSLLPLFSVNKLRGLGGLCRILLFTEQQNILKLYLG